MDMDIKGNPGLTRCASGFASGHPQRDMDMDIKGNPGLGRVMSGRQHSLASPEASAAGMAMAFSLPNPGRKSRSVVMKRSRSANDEEDEAEQSSASFNVPKGQKWRLRELKSGRHQGSGSNQLGTIISLGDGCTMVSTFSFPLTAWQRMLSKPGICEVETRKKSMQLTLK